MTLSVCLIVKDEQEVIVRCLNCASKFADEIVIVDTGSADNTVAMAKKFTDKVYFFKRRFFRRAQLRVFQGGVRACNVA